MNFDKEISEFKATFQQGNPLTKVTMIMGFILALTSLAELSSKIVTWKGFILSGIEFYKSFFVQPVISLASIAGLQYSEVELHLATISTVCVVTSMRILAMGQQVAFREISEEYGNKLKPNLLFYWLIAVLAPLATWLWYGFGNPTIYPWWSVLAAFFFPVFIVLPKALMAKFGRFEFFEQNKFSYFKSYYIYVGALVLFICMLAAINSGIRG
ncbi:heme transporter CcmC [Photobacterium leiognathi]|uniref:heme transporter CcmC n=1 Tax=Photobacterium leiognathi TaxID=553611 RepID=UPI001F32C072|nr:heme transporter CcmC [Photobacterium leiognathi]